MTCATWIDKVGGAATVAAHALRQAAMLAVPSGQHGHGFESSAFCIESAQGISAALPFVDGAMAVTIGADSSSCPATSTYIRERIRRRFTIPNIGLLDSDRQSGDSFPAKTKPAVTIAASTGRSQPAQYPAYG